MMQITGNELVRRAIEVAQIGSAEIPFDTLTFLVDQQYRRLVSDYGRIVRGAYGIVSEPLCHSHDNVWCMPDGIVARVYTKDAYNEIELTEEPFHYGQPDQGHYVIRDDGIHTANKQNLWVDYSKWPMTPTFIRKAIPLTGIPEKIFYDSETELIASLEDNILTLSNGEIVEGVLDIAGGPHELWISQEQYLYEYYSKREIDPTDETLYYDQKLRKLIPSETYYWDNNSTITIDNNRIFIDDIDVTDDYFIEPEVITQIIVSFPRAFVSYIVDGMTRCRVIGNDGSVYELEDETDSPIQLVPGGYTSDRTGYGLGAYVGAFPYVIGWTPCTRFDFDKSLYFDVMVTRLAVSILSYLGLGIDGQAALADRLEQEAFKQTKRTRATTRIRNIRRLR
jgi:hypothetical protein